MVWSRYTLGLQKVAEYFIWKNMLSVIGVPEDNFVKEIEVLVFES